MTTPSVNIKDEVRKLVGLQEIDRDIFALKRELEEIPEKIKALDLEFETKKAKLRSLEDQKQKNLLKQKEREGELGTKEEGIKKSQSQLGQLKTNKEYQTKLSEIESLKADKSVIEEEILKLMDEVDALKKDVDAEKGSLASEEKGFLEKKKSLSDRVQEAEGILNAQQGKRNIMAEGVDKKILGRYEHILGRDGVAIVKVQDSSCHGCHMKVPHQVINEIKMYEGLITCEVCSRLLYLEEDIRS